MVCQDPATLSLEVGKNIKEKYQAQATARQPLLLQALELCNKADLQYKVSKNQRLPVEITLMQLCGLDRTNEIPSGENFVIKPQPLKRPRRPKKQLTPYRQKLKKKNLNQHLHQPKTKF